MSVRIRRQRQRGPNINSRWCQKCGARNDYHAKFCRVCATPLGVEKDIRETTDSGNKK